MDENRNSLISIKHLSITITWGGGMKYPRVHSVVIFILLSFSCFPRLGMWNMKKEASNIMPTLLHLKGQFLSEWGSIYNLHKIL